MPRAPHRSTPRSQPATGTRILQPGLASTKGSLRQWGGDTHLLPPASGQLPGPTHTLTAGQGDRMGLGPSELLLLKAQLQLPQVLFFLLYHEDNCLHAAGRKHPQVRPPVRAMSFLFSLPRETQDLSPPGGGTHCPSRYLTVLPEDLHQEESQITHVPRRGHSDSAANR